MPQADCVSETQPQYKTQWSFSWSLILPLWPSKVYGPKSKNNHLVFFLFLYSVLKPRIAQFSSPTLMLSSVGILKSLTFFFFFLILVGRLKELKCGGDQWDLRSPGTFLMTLGIVIMPLLGCEREVSTWCVPHMCWYWSKNRRKINHGQAPELKKIQVPMGLPSSLACSTIWEVGKGITYFLCFHWYIDRKI